MYQALRERNVLLLEEWWQSQAELDRQSTLNRER
jgi:hypothetical protein